MSTKDPMHEALAAFRNKIHQSIINSPIADLNREYWDGLLREIKQTYELNGPFFYSCIQAVIQGIKHKLKDTQLQEEIKLQLESALIAFEKQMPPASEAIKLLNINLEKAKKELIDSFQQHGEESFKTLYDLAMEKIQTYYPNTGLNTLAETKLFKYFYYKIIENLILLLQSSPKHKELYQNLQRRMLKSTRAPQELSYFGLVHTEEVNKNMLKIFHGPLTLDAIMDFLIKKMEIVEDGRTEKHRRIEGEALIEYFLNALKNATLSPEQLHNLMREFYEYQKAAEFLKSENTAPVESFKLTNKLFEGFILNQINKHFDMISKAGEPVNPQMFKEKMLVYNQPERREDFLTTSNLPPNQNSILSDNFLIKLKIFLSDPNDHLGLLKQKEGDALKNYLAVLKEVRSLSLSLHVIPIITYLKTTTVPQQLVNDFMLLQIESLRQKCNQAYETNNITHLKALKKECDNAVKLMQQQDVGDKELWETVSNLITPNMKFLLKTPELTKSESVLQIDPTVTLHIQEDFYKAPSEPITFSSSAPQNKPSKPKTEEEKPKAKSAPKEKPLQPFSRPFGRF